MEYIDIVKQYAELEKYASGDDEGEYFWIFQASAYLHWHRLWKKQMKVNVRGGGRKKYYHSRKARSTHFMYRYPIESNGYFTGDI